jgi:hypothetical protein
LSPAKAETFLWSGPALPSRSLKAHIGVDADSGLVVHTVRGTSGNVADVTEGSSLFHCQDSIGANTFMHHGFSRNLDFWEKSECS